MCFTLAMSLCTDVSCCAPGRLLAVHSVAVPRLRLLTWASRDDQPCTAYTHIGMVSSGASSTSQQVLPWKCCANPLDVKLGTPEHSLYPKHEFVDSSVQAVYQHVLTQSQAALSQAALHSMDTWTKEP